MSSRAAQDRRHNVELPLTFAVCSNDPSRVRAHSIQNLGQLAPEDRLLIVFDTENDPPMSAIAAEIRSEGAAVMFGGPSRGLSYARNAAMRSALTRHIIFIDDDVTLSRRAVEDIRSTFIAGSNIVGVRLEPGPGVDLSRWYISPAQFHYLGLHRDDMAGKTWGACMGFDLEFVNKHQLQFRIELGRKGRSLISGDDTTFIRQCIRLQARETFLENTRVQHHVAPDRLLLGRLLSRAWWQGRSEVRRSSTYSGALKEWERNTCGWRQRPIRTISLAVLYQAMVLVGIAIELFSSDNQNSFPLTVQEKPTEPSKEGSDESVVGVRRNV